METDDTSNAHAENIETRKMVLNQNDPYYKLLYGDKENRQQIISNTINNIGNALMLVSPWKTAKYFYYADKINELISKKSKNNIESQATIESAVQIDASFASLSKLSNLQSKQQIVKEENVNNTRIESTVKIAKRTKKILSKVNRIEEFLMPKVKLDKGFKQGGELNNLLQQIANGTNGENLFDWDDILWFINPKLPKIRRLLRKYKWYKKSTWKQAKRPFWKRNWFKRWAYKKWTNSAPYKTFKKVQNAYRTASNVARSIGRGIKFVGRGITKTTKYIGKGIKISTRLIGKAAKPVFKTLSKTFSSKIGRPLLQKILKASVKIGPKILPKVLNKIPYLGTALSIYDLIEINKSVDPERSILEELFPSHISSTEEAMRAPWIEVENKSSEAKRRYLQNQYSRMIVTERKSNRVGEAVSCAIPAIGLILWVSTEVLRSTPKCKTVMVEKSEKTLQNALNTYNSVFNEKTTHRYNAFQEHSMDTVLSEMYGNEIYMNILNMNWIIDMYFQFRYPNIITLKNQIFDNLDTTDGSAEEIEHKKSSLAHRCIMQWIRYYNEYFANDQHMDQSFQMFVATQAPNQFQINGTTFGQDFENWIEPLTEKRYKNILKNYEIKQENKVKEDKLKTLETYRNKISDLYNLYEAFLLFQDTKSPQYDRWPDEIPIAETPEILQSYLYYNNKITIEDLMDPYKNIWFSYEKHLRNSLIDYAKIKTTEYKEKYETNNGKYTYIQHLKNIFTAKGYEPYHTPQKNKNWNFLCYVKNEEIALYILSKGIDPNKSNDSKIQNVLKQESLDEEFLKETESIVESSKYEETESELDVYTDWSNPMDNLLIEIGNKIVEEEKLANKNAQIYLDGSSHIPLKFEYDEFGFETGYYYDYENNSWKTFNVNNRNGYGNDFRPIYKEVIDEYEYIIKQEDEYTNKLKNELKKYKKTVDRLEEKLIPLGYETI